MILPVPHIAQLCETWWERMADEPRAWQGRYADELLRLLGWETPLPFSPREASTSLGARPFILRANGKNTCIVYFVQPGTIDPPSAVVERGLDFCPATRMLAEEAHEIGVSRALITDLYRFYLYDSTKGELLRAADDPRRFSDDLVPVLTRERAESGALQELRGPSRTASGRQLRTWCERWTRLIARHARLTEEKSALIIDRLLVIRFIFERDILRRTRPRLEQRFHELIERASTPRAHGVGQGLTALFHDMWFDWRLDLFEALPDLDRALEDDEIAVPLLREFTLLADNKFTFDTILESFNFGDPTEKQRIRMVPDANDERDQYLAAQTLNTIDQARVEIEITEEGYRALTYWFDRVTQLYDRVENDFRKMFYAAEQRKEDAGTAPEKSPDLFAWAVIDGERPRACADKFFHACAQGFGAFYSSPRQFRTARLVMTLHLIHRYHESAHAAERMPSLGQLLMPRPQVLTAARLMRVREELPAPAASVPGAEGASESAA